MIETQNGENMIVNQRIRLTVADLKKILFKGVCYDTLLSNGRKPDPELGTLRVVQKWSGSELTSFTENLKEIGMTMKGMRAFVFQNAENVIYIENGIGQLIITLTILHIPSEKKGENE